MQRTNSNSPFQIKEAAYEKQNKKMRNMQRTNSNSPFQIKEAAYEKQNICNVQTQTHRFK
jgi:hypothetical protein